MKSSTPGPARSIISSTAAELRLATTAVELAGLGDGAGVGAGGGGAAEEVGVSVVGAEEKRDAEESEEVYALSPAPMSEEGGPAEGGWVAVVAAERA